MSIYKNIFGNMTPDPAVSGSDDFSYGSAFNLDLSKGSMDWTPHTLIEMPAAPPPANPSAREKRQTQFQQEYDSLVEDDDFLGNLGRASKFSKALGIGEGTASLFSALQSVFAKPTTVTPPSSVVLERPQIRSESEATRALIKENMGTGMNTWLQTSREMGFDPTRAGVGMFGQASRVMRESAAQLGERDQNLINQASIINADIAGKEAMINAELRNRYAERRDATLAMDSEKRGMQFSQAISNFGALASRTINDQILIERLKAMRKEDIHDKLMARYTV